mmetsp:Transcript_37533/g.87517  ORF Transcript_37533/g.87517 Transcript_37533/m.87517 type:complete len:88 (+) Transcript_37533:238-501(+)
MPIAVLFNLVCGISVLRVDPFFGIFAKMTNQEQYPNRSTPLGCSNLQESRGNYVKQRLTFDLLVSRSSPSLTVTNVTDFGKKNLTAH